MKTLKSGRMPAACLGALVLASLFLLLGCRAERSTGLVRLGDRLHPGGSEVRLPASGPMERPVVIRLDREASEIGSISIGLAGSAKSAGINWLREGEKEWRTGRRVEFPLDPSGSAKTYDVDLSREQQWIGPIRSIKITAFDGSARLDGLVLHPLPSAYRSISLRGVTMPSLLGRERLEIPFDGDLPARSRFEAWIGLMPEFDRRGATAHFKLSVRKQGSTDERGLWEGSLAGGGEELTGWQPVAFDLSLPERGALILEARAEIGGREVSRGVARWGDPVLVPRRRAPGRNLVLVVVDTLRADELGAYGSRRGLTPNLDALAARSVRFDQLHAAAPWTLPSMATILTGLAPRTHGAGLRFGEEAPTGLAEGFTTLAERLAAAGFYTSAVYKNIYLNPEFGMHQGFDVYAAEETRPAAPGSAEPLREADARDLVDRAIAELQRVRDRRFFLYVHLFDPHNPYEAPKSWCDSVARRIEPRYAGPLGCRVDRRPENPLPPATDFPWIRALYDAEVAYTDHELGRFFAEIDRQGLGDSTVLAFASDHGEEFYERLDQETRLGYEADSDHGHSHYEELLHVPAMIRAPGEAPGVVQDPVGAADLFPTLLSALGVANGPNDPPIGDAQDLLATLRGHRPRPAPLISEVILHGPPRWAIRRGPWKLIQGERADGPVELYDLATDPGEVRDLSSERPDVVAGLRALFGQKTGSAEQLRAQLLPRGGVRATYVSWAHIAKLRSLGYLR